MKHSFKNKQPWLLTLLLVCLGFGLFGQNLPLKQGVTNDEKTRVISYLPYYKMNLVSGEIFNHLTHLNYFALGTNSSGELGRINNTGVFTHIDHIPQVVTDLDTLKKWRGELESKIFVVFGGWVQSDYFDEMAADDDARANFIKNVKNFLLNNELDGADIDWEGYHGAVDDADYKKLLSEMKQAFDGTELGLSVAIGKTHTSLADEFMESDVEHIGLMTYGKVFDDGMQVSLNQLKGYVSDWIEAGATKEKLVLGVPFYGRTPSDGSSVTYRKLIETYSPGNEVNSLVHNSKTYYFNGVDAISAKANYVKDEGLKGIMIWEQGQDVDLEHDQSLLKTISQVLPLDYATSVHDGPVLIPNKIEGIKVYPSPFQSNLNVALQAKSGSNIKFSVFDINGKQVHFSQNEARFSGEQGFELPLDSLLSGVYFLNVNVENRSKTIKIIKQ